MESKIIQKYAKYSVEELEDIAERHFNKFIRYRDTDDDGYGNCISSKQPLRVPSRKAHAGHYYPAGKYKALKFNEDNVHLQGLSDNYFKSANLLEYRKNLIKKIGIERVEILEEIAERTKGVYKLDRFFLIETIEKYKEKCKKFSKNEW